MYNITTSSRYTYCDLASSKIFIIGAIMMNDFVLKYFAQKKSMFLVFEFKIST